MGIFATVYVFDTDVSQKMQIQQKIEAAYRRDKKSFFQNEPLPPEKYWALPFNLMIKGMFFGINLSPKCCYLLKVITVETFMYAMFRKKNICCLPQNLWKHKCKNSFLKQLRMI